MAYSAILLAAGTSSRMGKANKLALELDGEALLRRTARTLLKSGLQEIVVVLGHEIEITRPLLYGFNIRVVVNKNYEDGQMSSVHCGIGALRKPTDGIIVCLSDLPFLQVDDIHNLCDAFSKLEGKSILVPTFEGERGNPIVLSGHHREEILAGNRNLGCKKLIQKNPELVATLEMKDDRLTVDMDTPEAFEDVKQRLAKKTKITMPLSNREEFYEQRYS